MAILWSTDRYTVTAGDAAADAVSRGFNLNTGRWETLSGTVMKVPPDITDRGFRVKYFAIKVWEATYGNLRHGLVGHLYVVPSCDSVDGLMKLPASYIQGGSSTISFRGDYPMLGGVQYRVLLGACSATDEITAILGYEKLPALAGGTAGQAASIPPVDVRRDMKVLWGQATGSAASTYVSLAPSAGQTYRVIHAEAHTDDPAGVSDTYWGVLNGGTGWQISEKEAKAQWARSYLYQRAYYLPECLILHYGDTLRFYGSVTAAGKKYYMEYCIERRTGELGYGAE